MTLLLKFLRYNDILAGFISLFCNFVLLYLVVTVNKATMKQISLTLLQNCLLDLFLSIITILTEVQVAVINQICYMIIGSFLYKFGSYVASILIALYGAFVLTSINAMAIPFYIRYMVICNDRQPQFSRLIKLYAILTLTFILNIAGLLWTYPPITEHYKEFKNNLMTDFWLNEYDGGPSFVATKIEGKISFIIPYGFLFFTATVAYSFIIYFSVKITQSLQKYVNKHPATKLLSRQLHKTLIIQAIGPFFVGYLPVLTLIAMIFFQYENQYVTVCLSFFLGWIPVINPLAAMIIVSPYRKRIQEILGIERKTFGISNNTNQTFFSSSFKLSSISKIAASSVTYFRS